ncbi:MAG: TIGR00282 family metallophosphoesterase, partial [Candidatus Gracilibacteria bacterium]
MKVLFFGDIVGRAGRNAVKRFLSEEKGKIKPDLVIANSDNIASGRGPTLKTYEEIIQSGVDVLTPGDHIWDQKEVIELLESKKAKIARPLNFPKICPGKNHVEVEVKGKKVAVVGLVGRVWTLEGLDSPFAKMDEFLSEHQNKFVIVDLHAEATSEKVAMGHYLAGRVAAVLGTHTHVQTADEKVINKTAYISDTGSCAPTDSVIGVVKEQSLKRFTTGLPVIFDVAEGPCQINAVLVEIDEK